MKEDRSLPWHQLWDFIGACTESRDVDGLFRIVVSEIGKLVPCDQAHAVITEISPRSPPLGEMLASGLPQPGNLVARAVSSVANTTAIDAYIKHYIYLDYAMLHQKPGNLFFYYNWRERAFSKLEFTRDFMFPLMKADVSTGLAFFAEDGHGGVGLSLERTGKGDLSDRELSILLAVRPRIDNLYNLLRRYQSFPAELVSNAELIRSHELLSKREAEIASLLCKRLRPSEIATMLLISRRTVERHIEHIYGKLDVCCRKDMIGALMGPGGGPNVRGIPSMFPVSSYNA